MITPNKQQSAIYTAIREESYNILVSAKAGTGKTTLIKHAAINCIPPSQKILLLAFNKKIVEEMQKKISAPNLTIATSHSTGLKVIRENVKHKVEVDSYKASNAVKFMLSPSNPNSWKDVDYYRDDFKKWRSDMIKMVDLARMEFANNEAKMMELAKKHNMFLTVEDCSKVKQICAKVQNDLTKIDYVDMIFQPSIRKSWTRKKYDWVLIDECQDLNPCQQVLFKSLLKENGRFVAVGDPAQAIYGFAGADSDSFSKIAQSDNTVVMPLNECYRCGKEILKHVNATTDSDIFPPENAAEGKVEEQGSINEPLKGDMVLCRNIAPLVRLCYKLIGENRSAYISGKKAGRDLVSFIKGFKTTRTEELLDKMSTHLSNHKKELSKQFPLWSEEDILESDLFTEVAEKIEIIDFIINTVGRVKREEPFKFTIEVVDHIIDLFKEKSNAIVLSTIHRAKGLENERVFILDAELMPSKHAKLDWQLIQEENLRYVAQTRAKKYLCYITDWSGLKN